MKKLFSVLFLLAFAGANGVFADTATKETADTATVNVPKWEDYVPEAYQNPRSDFNKGKSIAELSAGIVLTDLLITAPIGIPMMVHGTTKLKNISYSKKKVKFEKGLAEAEQIADLNEREKYYKQLLLSCDMTEKRKAKLAKKRAKANKKQKTNK